jgi:hypothetical protein
LARLLILDVERPGVRRNKFDKKAAPDRQRPFIKFIPNNTRQKGKENGSWLMERTG